MAKGSTYATATPTTSDSALGIQASGPNTKRFLLSDLITLFLNNIPAAEGGLPFVSSGLVWSGDAYASTRAASMTAGRIKVNTSFLSISAVTARVFTASKDTYVDVLDNLDGTGTLVYTEVSNNAASPALAANSTRIAIIVTGASNIAAAGSVNQGQQDKVLPIASSIAYSVTDSLGNLICPRDPNHQIIGYRQITANVTTTSTSFANVAGLSAPAIVPDGRKVLVEAFFQAVAETNSPVGMYTDVADGSTQLAQNLITSPNANYQAQSNNPKALATPSAGLHTYNARNKVDANTGTWYAGSTSPAFIIVRLN